MCPKVGSEDYDNSKYVQSRRTNIHSFIGGDGEVLHESEAVMVKEREVPKRSQCLVPHYTWARTLSNRQT